MDALTLRAILTLDKSGYDKGLRDADNEAENAAGNIGGKFQKLGGVIKAGLIAGGVAAAGAIVKIGKDALTAYASYEQLSGGIEILYKGSADELMKYADKAYATAGMSANQYMEQASGFASALIQSLNGDTQKAAKLTDTAMKDMSDNVNTFGSDAEAVQYAYQGFAKQNFTMLDNLKLGYGGTKTEMERLLTDAENIKKAHGEMADYSIDSFSDIVEAIHTVQEEQGITGKTAAEAKDTIEGSVNSMKASWTNLLTEMGKSQEESDVPGKTKILMENIKNVIKNVVPVMANIAKGLWGALVEGLKKLGDMDYSGQAGSFVGKVIKAAVKALIKLAPLLVKAALNLIRIGMMTILDALLKLIGTSISKVGEDIKLGFHKIKSIVSNIWEAIKNIIKQKIQAAKDAVVQTIKAIAALGLSIFNGFANGVRNVFTKIQTSVRNKVTAIKNTMVSVFTGARDRVLGLFDSIRDGIKNKIQSAKDTVKNIVEKIKNIFPIKFGKLFKGLKLPHFDVDPGKFPWGVGGSGRLPSWNVEWYKKAYNEPYVFNKPTIMDGKGFGDGRGGEIVYGKENLMEDIKKATQPHGDTITINVYATDRQDEKKVAEEVQKQFVLWEKQRRAVFA